MNLTDAMLVISKEKQEELSDKLNNELNSLGVKLSPEQTESIIESARYEAIGRGLTQKVNVLHAESGAIITKDFFDALLVVYVARSQDFFIVTPYIQPLFNIQNDYMGFLYYGKMRNLRQEKKRMRMVKNILMAMTGIMAFVIGLTAPFFDVIAFIVAVGAFGYLSFLDGRE